MGISVSFGGGSRRNKRTSNSKNNSNNRVGRIVKSGKKKMLFGIVFIVVATIVFFLMRHTIKEEANYIETTGYVVDYREEYDYSDDEYTYAEIIEYVVDGKPYRHYSSSYSLYPKRIGKRVMVRYDPESPDKSTLNSENSGVVVYVLCGFFAFVGVCVLISGVKTLMIGEIKSDS